MDAKPDFATLRANTGAVLYKGRRLVKNTIINNINRVTEITVAFEIF